MLGAVSALQEKFICFGWDRAPFLCRLGDDGGSSMAPDLRRMDAGCRTGVVSISFLRAGLFVSALWGGERFFFGESNRSAYYFERDDFRLCQPWHQYECVWYGHSASNLDAYCDICDRNLSVYAGGRDFERQSETEFFARIYRRAYVFHFGLARFILLDFEYLFLFVETARGFRPSQFQIRSIHAECLVSHHGARADDQWDLFSGRHGRVAALRVSV